MIALIIIAIIVAVIVFLLLSRVKITLKYDQTVTAYAKFLFFKFPIYPKKKKVKLSRYKTKRHKKRPKKLRAKKRAIKKAHVSSVKKRGSLTEKISLIVYLLRKIFRKFFGRLRIDVKEVDISISTADPAKTALLYAAAYNGAEILLDIIDENTNIRQKSVEDIKIYPDFTKTTSNFYLNLIFSISVISILDIGIKIAYNYLKKKTSDNINKNGGRDNGKQPK